MLTGLWINEAGPLGASIALLVGGIGVAVVGFNYAIVAQKFPLAGGEMVYAQQFFGHKTSQITGYLLLLLFLSVAAFEGIAVAWVLSILIPSLRNSPVYHALGQEVYGFDLAVAIGGTFTLVVLTKRGASSSGKTQNILVCLFAIASLCFISLGLASTEKSNLQPLIAASSNNSYITNILKVLAITPFMYAGFNCIPQAVPEASNATLKILPRIVLLCVLVSGLFYVLVIFATAGVMHRSELLNQELPVARAMEVAFNSRAIANIVLCAGLLGLITTWNAMFFASTRLMSAMAGQRLLPSVLAIKDATTGAPRTAILLTAAISGTAMFLGRGFVVPIVNTGSTIISFMFLLVCLGLFKDNLCEKNKVVSERLYSFVGILISGFLFLLSLHGQYQDSHYLIPIEWLILTVWLLMAASINVLINKFYQ